MCLAVQLPFKGRIDREVLAAAFSQTLLSDELHTVG